MKEVLMLVLQRKVGEEIRVGDSIIVKVLATNRRATRLGIEAPAAIPILRGEFLSSRTVTTRIPVPGPTPAPNVSLGG
jgi:carbon storage regulator CsrA